MSLPVALLVLYAVTSKVRSPISAGSALLTPVLAFAAPVPSTVESGQSSAKILSGAQEGRPLRLSLTFLARKTSRSDIVRDVLLLTTFSVKVLFFGFVFVPASFGDTLVVSVAVSGP